MFMTTQPQQHRARRIARVVRAIPVRAGMNIRLKRVIGGEGLHDLDPFLAFDELTASTADGIDGGFPGQTHRGFESITYITKGCLHYSDNAGREGTVGAGGVQWLTSGRGLVHSETPELAEGEVRTFQFWLNLPAAEKMQMPVYRAIEAADIPAVIFPKAEVRVIAGRYHGLLGPVSPESTCPFVAEVILKPEGEVTLPMDQSHDGFIYVYEGGAAVAQTLISCGQAGILDSGNVLTLTAGQAGARLLVLSARPLREPIVRHGPFVMTSQQDIKQAFTDYQNGLF
ncbi:pirin family protein [Asticcacaulis sp.]|uniref:pirin family protein n=1 Tax=Asticcacaulis sp. TaxID=1872648 RepID=UPI002BE44956|nr:pirin family protein [Asticcacaulis sp.]HTM82353.1 pirin family protein [Asticcacaulis sp.]